MVTQFVFRICCISEKIPCHVTTRLSCLSWALEAGSGTKIEVSGTKQKYHFQSRAGVRQVFLQRLAFKRRLVYYKVGLSFAYILLTFLHTFCGTVSLWLCQRSTAAGWMLPLRGSSQPVAVLLWHSQRLTVPQKVHRNFEQMWANENPTLW